LAIHRRNVTHLIHTCSTNTRWLKPAALYNSRLQIRAIPLRGSRLYRESNRLKPVLIIPPRRKPPEVISRPRSDGEHVLKDDKYAIFTVSRHATAAATVITESLEA
jgi:hypothetical protein